MAYSYDLFGALLILTGMLFLKSIFKIKPKNVRNNFANEIYLVLGLSSLTIGGMIIAHPLAAVFYLMVLILLMFILLKIIKAISFLVIFFRTPEVKIRKFKNA